MNRVKRSFSSPWRSWRSWRWDRSILDGGNAFAQQRVTQNGADAAASAGAVVLVQNLISVGVGGSATKTDQDVLTDVNAKAASNGISPAPTSYYTDISGNRLPGPIVVGSLGGGALPPATAYGVEVGWIENVQHVHGIDLQFGTRGNRLRAVHGEREGDGHRGTSQGDLPCGRALRVPAGDVPDQSDPVRWIGEAGQLRRRQPLSIRERRGSQQRGDPTALQDGTRNASAGSISIHTPRHATAVARSSSHARSGRQEIPACRRPIWIHTVTGNTNSVQVQDAINQFIGKTVQIPFYECTSDNVGQVGPAPYCPGSVIDPGTPGCAAWHQREQHVLPDRGDRELRTRQRVHPGQQPRMQSKRPGSPFVGGNGSTGCLKGWFVEALNYGTTVGLPSNTTPWSAYGTQLIR